MLKFASPLMPNLEFAFSPTRNPNANQWNIGGIGSSGIGHVYFIYISYIFHVYFMLFLHHFPRWLRENSPTQRQFSVEYGLNAKICVTPDAKPKICVIPDANPRRQSVEYRFRWVPTQNAGIGHVHFMFFVYISFAFGTQREPHFQWNMGVLHRYLTPARPSPPSSKSCIPPYSSSFVMNYLLKKAGTLLCKHCRNIYISCFYVPDHCDSCYIPAPRLTGP